MIINNKGWSINMLKIKNVLKSNDVVQVYECNKGTFDNGTYVNIGVTTHNQYNLEVQDTKYTKYTKCQKNTMNNINIIQANSENCTSVMR